ncbi:MAG: hypothetical protein V2A53_00980 [bacterium]
MKVYLNGRFVEERLAKVSVFDRSFLYGDGIFETLRAYCGKIFREKEHRQVKKVSRGYLPSFARD